MGGLSNPRQIFAPRLKLRLQLENAPSARGGAKDPGAGDKGVAFAAAPDHESASGAVHRPESQEDADMSTNPDSAAVTAELRRLLPLDMTPFEVGARRVGLVIVDEVNGFCSVGHGNLAPPVENPQVSHMVAETDRLARAFAARNLPIMAFLDTHEPGKPEPPYPPHCERGTGEENLVPALEWLEDDAQATLLRKDCINGFIGAIREDGSNAVVDWVRENRIARLLVVGICTDICVMDFVLTALSARNHGLLAGVSDILVYSRGCSTYALPRPLAESLGLGAKAAHPQDATHFMGLYFMASRGAGLLGSVELPDG